MMSSKAAVQKACSLAQVRRVGVVLKLLKLIHGFPRSVCKTATYGMTPHCNNHFGTLHAAGCISRMGRGNWSIAAAAAAAAATGTEAVYMASPERDTYSGGRTRSTLDPPSRLPPSPSSNHSGDLAPQSCQNPIRDRLRVRPAMRAVSYHAAVVAVVAVVAAGAGLAAVAEPAGGTEMAPRDRKLTSG